MVKVRGLRIVGRAYLKVRLPSQECACVSEDVGA